MAQNQLIEYVSSQLKLGVSHDEVRKALIGAGWAANDVDEALKGAGGGTPPPALPATPAPASPSPSVSTPASPASPSSPSASAPLSSKVFPTTIGGANNGGPRTIRVSDMVSASSASSASSPNRASSPTGAGSPGGASIVGGGVKGNMIASTSPKAPEKKKFSMFGHHADKPAGKPNPADPAPLDLASASARAAVMQGKTKGGKGGRFMTVILIILVLGAGGFAGYLYMQNNNLAAKIASLGGESANVAAQVSSLKDQVAALNASNTALTAEAGSLNSQNEELLANLSFVGVPSSTGTSTVAEENVTVVGTLSKAKGSYVLRSQYGVSVYVKNSADAAVTAVLNPLADGSTAVTLAGTHVPGTSNMTVTAVNGSPIVAAPQAASSTSTSTPSQ